MVDPCPARTRTGSRGAQRLLQADDGTPVQGYGSEIVALAEVYASRGSRRGGAHPAKRLSAARNSLRPAGNRKCRGRDPDTFLLRCRLHSFEGRQTRHGEFPYVRTGNRAWIRSGQGHLIAGRPSFLDDDRPSGAYSSLRSV